MNIQTFPDYEQLSGYAAQLIIEVIRDKPAALICIASGDTPMGACRYLVQAAQEGRVDVSQCTFVGLDEWVGMDENDHGSCKYTMKYNLFDPLGLRPDQVVYFDAKAKDLDADCQRVNQFIASAGGVDLMLVGVGMNGHIALNEPGTPFDSYAHVSELEEITAQVGQKYFTQATELKLGITLGLRHLYEAGKAVVIASGDKKAEIMRTVLQGEISTKVPASIIQTIPDGIVLLDQAAAKLL